MNNPYTKLVLDAKQLIDVFEADERILNRPQTKNEHLIAYSAILHALGIERNLFTPPLDFIAGWHDEREWDARIEDQEAVLADLSHEISQRMLDLAFPTENTDETT